MRKKQILIVEDTVEQLNRYISLLKDTMLCLFTSSVQEAKNIMDTQSIDIVLTDIHLSESMSQSSYEGYEIIAYAREYHPEILILAMSADPKIETYNKVHALGAHHWVKKPIIDFSDISIAISVGEQNRFNQRMLADKSIMANDIDSICEDGLVLDQKLRKLIRGIAISRTIPCVIYGETGTGKEEVAKLIHKRRTESEGPIPFVATNCSNLNSDMAQSVLFGHRKGSFTGANVTTNGLVGEANGGILFLDEIHRLEPKCQARLLRVLNDGSYERLGDTKSLYSNFQVVVASSLDLDDAVLNGSFLMDLRSRLTGIDLSLSPLRERKEEIKTLVALFFAKERIKVSEYDLDAITRKCREFYWQGNIRQLFNVLKSFHTICSLNEEPYNLNYFPSLKTMFPPSSAMESIQCKNNDRFKPLKELVENVERQALESALKHFRNKSEAVRALEMNRSTFDSKLIKYGLDN